MIPLNDRANVQTTGLTLQAYAAAKKLPVAFLHELGLRDQIRNGRPVVRIPYVDEDGQDVAVRYRQAMDGDTRFLWRTGDKPILYGLSGLTTARRRNLVTLVEGESDTHTLLLHGEPALGLPGAATWRDDWAQQLDGIEEVYVVIEPDRGGRTVLDKLAASPLRDRIKLIRLGDKKDVSGLYLSAPTDFDESWQRYKRAAQSLSAYLLEQEQRQAEADWQICAPLAQAPDILHLMEQAIAASGFVGEGRSIRLIYLAVTSRLLAKPVSIAVKGPSSAGKSALAARVLELFPPSAYHALSAMSEKALVYSEEPMSHRFLVIFEAAGLRSEFATYMVRSLLSEGCIRYETVEKTPQGMKPRLVVRDGPTGLLVTTTELSLHPENETRFFSVPATDTREQTAAVLDALAAQHAGEAPAPLDIEPWRALQRWLEQGRRDVLVPFAPALAKQVTPVAVRLRRDFGAVLNVVRAHALLHQVNRLRDDKGRIIATLQDYAAVYGLVHDLIAEGAGAAVSPCVRETVAAVESLLRTPQSTVTITEVAKLLELDTSSASRRVKAAIRAGFLENQELHPRRPAKLGLGEPVPDARGVLPEPGSLQVCTAAEGVAHE